MAYNTWLVLLATIPCIVKHAVRLGPPMNPPVFCAMVVG
jgi:hypothetical protein